MHQLFRELRLWNILDGCFGTTPWADRVALLVANRLSRPSSEHGLGTWLETQYVVDRGGKRYLPRWKERGRVKVDLAWLQPFYRTLDQLIEHKETIEKALYLELRDLFDLKVDMVFYDLTSTYFEGEGPETISRYGYSRDKRRQNRQILVGMVMVKGFPIAHHVFEGNLQDDKTVETVIHDLEKRFEVGRIIFVGDRGMMTTDVLSFVRDKKHGYLMGLKRRRQPEVIQAIEKLTGEGTECPVGITASEQHPAPKTWVWEVSGTQEKERIFVVHSEERHAYEEAMRKRSMNKVREELERLKKRVAKGKLQKKGKIGFAGRGVLSQHKGHRYFDWKISEKGQFEYFEHPVFLKQEKKIEGKYLIQTEEKDLDPVDAVDRYKELMEVEREFKSLKDVLEMRPIYHQTEHRVRAHVFVAALAFLLERVLEKKLKMNAIHLSAREACRALDTVSVVNFQVPSGNKRGVTAGSIRARQVLRALGVQRAALPNSKHQDKPADVVTHQK